MSRQQFKCDDDDEKTYSGLLTEDKRDGRPVPYGGTL